MEKNKEVTLCSDDNNKEVSFEVSYIIELDYIKSMIRDGVIQVKMPIKVRCNYDDLELLKKYLTLKNSEEKKEDFHKFKNDLFSLEDEYHMKRFFSFTKCVHYLKAYEIIDLITTFLALEIDSCENKNEVCKKFNIPEILVEDN